MSRYSLPLFQARAQLADNLRKSRELTNKAKSSMETDSEEEGYEDVDLSEEVATNKENPWVGQEDNEVASFVSGYRKFWNEQNKKRATEESAPGIVSSSESADRNEELEKLTKEPVEETSSKEITRKETVEPAAPEEASDLESKINGAVPSEGEVEEEEDREMKGSNVGKTEKKIRKRGRKTRKSRSVMEGPEEGVGEDVDKGTLEPERKGKKRIAVTSNSGQWVVEDDATSNPAERTNIVKARKPADKKKLIENLFEEVETLEGQRPPERRASRKKEGKKPIKRAKPTEKPSHLDLSFKQPKSLSVDESLIEMSGEGISSGLSDVRNLLKKVEDAHKPAEIKTNADIDPTNFLPVKTQKVDTAIPNLVDDADSDSGNENAQRLNLMEAFADDDIADEFRL